MSLEHLPENIEEGVQRFAREMRISHEDAVLKLIETGLTLRASDVMKGPKSKKGKKPGELLIGLMSSPDDAAMMDDIVKEAMQARRRRWERLASA